MGILIPIYRNYTRNEVSFTFLNRTFTIVHSQYVLVSWVLSGRPEDALLLVLVYLGFCMHA